MYANFLGNPGLLPLRAQANFSFAFSKRKIGAGPPGRFFWLLPSFRTNEKSGLNSFTGEAGVEPATPGFGDRCSSQLSYSPNSPAKVLFLYAENVSCKTDKT